MEGIVGEADDGCSDEDSYGSLSDYDDEDSSALIELLPRVAVQAMQPVKGPGSVAPNDSSINDHSFEVLPDDAGNAQQPDVARLEAVPEGRDGQDEESYYTEQEQESYEPPLSYD